MTEISLIQIADDFIIAFNETDWQGFRAPLAADLQYSETGTGRRTEGADAYTQLCQGWKEAFPDVNGVIRQVVANGNHVVQEISWEGTHTGPLMTPNGAIPPSNRRIAVPASVWYSFRGDKVEEIRHHIDLMSMLQQVGALGG